MLKYAALALSLALAVGCSEENDESCDSEVGDVCCKGFTQDCPKLDWDACRVNDQCLRYSAQNAAGEWIHACLNSCQIGRGYGGYTGGEGEYQLCFAIGSEYYGTMFGTRYKFMPEDWIEVNFGYCKFLYEDKEDGGVPE